MTSAEIETLKFYEQLAHQNASDAFALYLQCNAVKIQLGAMIMQRQRDLVKQSRWQKIKNVFR